MKPYAFRIVNVFARAGRLTGNPLCVFEDGRGLDDETMQALGRQFNLSETTFILPAKEATAHVRIFTPAYEMPFAGHPTLGTAHVVRSLRSCGDSLSLEMKAGVIPVKAEHDRWTLTARAATTRPVAEPRASLAAALGLNDSDFASDPIWLNAGTEQMMVPVASLDAVDRARPDPSAFMRFQSQEPAKVYVFHDEGDAAGGVKARFFFPAGAAILEDPATGSACANLGGWFVHKRPGEDIAREISQGEMVRRPSTLQLTVRSGSVYVGGLVIELGRGVIEI